VELKNQNGETLTTLTTKKSKFNPKNTNTPTLPHTEAREKSRQLKTQNTKHVYVGTMPTLERDCGSSSYRKQSTNQIVNLKMASWVVKCSAFKCM
jgi:hypothetical protein